MGLFTYNFDGFGCTTHIILLLMQELINWLNRASLVAQMVKNLPAMQETICNAGDSGSSPGLGRHPGVGHGNSFQYSCLENSTDRETWWATVYGAPKSWTRLWLSMHSHKKYLTVYVPTRPQPQLRFTLYKCHLGTGWPAVRVFLGPGRFPRCGSFHFKPRIVQMNWDVLLGPEEFSRVWNLEC